MHTIGLQKRHKARRKIIAQKIIHPRTVMALFWDVLYKEEYPLRRNISNYLFLDTTTAASATAAGINARVIPVSGTLAVSAASGAVPVCSV